MYSRHIRGGGFKCKILTASRLHKEDVTKCSFTCSFDAFIRYNIPRYIATSDALSSDFITASSIISIPVLYYSPIKFSTFLNFGSVPIISAPDPDSYTLSFSVTPLSDIA